MTDAYRRSDSIQAGRQGRRLPDFRRLGIYVANVLLVGGAALISILPGSASSSVVFAGFFVGHACLSRHSIRLRDHGLLFLNSAMAMLDLYAISIRL